MANYRKKKKPKENPNNNPNPQKPIQTIKNWMAEHEIKLPSKQGAYGAR